MTFSHLFNHFLLFIQVFLYGNSIIFKIIVDHRIQYIHVAIAAQRHMDQAWFPHTRLDRHLISQLNAHSRSPSLSHTPLCSFSNPQFLSLSLAFFLLSVFSPNLSFSRPQSLPEPCSISLFLIFSSTIPFIVLLEFSSQLLFLPGTHFFTFSYSHIQ